MNDKKKLKRKIKKLQYKLGVAKYKRKQAVKQHKFWQSIVAEQDIEIEQLKAPKVQAWLNGEPMEIVSGDDGDKQS